MKKKFFLLGMWYVSKEEGQWCIYMKPIKDWLMHPIRTYKLFNQHKPTIISAGFIPEEKADEC